VLLADKNRVEFLMRTVGEGMNAEVGCEHSGIAVCGTLQICQTNVWLMNEENKIGLAGKILVFNNLAERVREVASFDSYLASM
jgi:hypothetical protein